MSGADGRIRVGVIMAGGSGERFWPVSRMDHPKQLLKLTRADQTMLGEAVERLAPIIPPERTYVVTGERLIGPIREAGIGVPDANVIAEPYKRNTAGCLAYATAHIVTEHGGDPAALSMAVVTADHRIEDGDRFRETVLAALEAAEARGALATHGIVPTRPETGYGYIQAQDVGHPALAPRGIPVYPVAAFHEKPNEEKAEDFISTGMYFWNSGMFFWPVDVFLAELEQARPEMAEATRRMIAAIQRNDKGTVKMIFEKIEDISIDYALMEHSKNVLVARADYGWDDVGAWTSLDRTREHDAQGNVTQGDPVLIDTRNSIVYNAPGDDKVSVSVVGMDNVVVVTSGDAVLVVSKDRVQEVRHAVRELKARGSKHV